MPDEKAPESRKVSLFHPRRLRPFGERELQIFEAGAIVELPTKEALRLIGNGLADGVTDDTNSSKGTPVSGGAPAKRRGRPPKSETAEASD